MTYKIYALTILFFWFPVLVVAQNAGGHFEVEVRQENNESESDCGTDSLCTKDYIELITGVIRLSDCDKSGVGLAECVTKKRLEEKRRLLEEYARNIE